MNYNILVLAIKLVLVDGINKCFNFKSSFNLKFINFESIHLICFERSTKHECRVLHFNRYHFTFLIEVDDVVIRGWRF